MIDINKKYRYRSGESARIICTDRNTAHPIVSLRGESDITTHYPDGRHSREISDFDLIEVREPREWKATITRRGKLIYYEPGDEDDKRYEVIRVREIID